MVLAIISPHLDDASLSCSRIVASHPGSHVVTVFAGGPSAVTPVSAWDKASGFRDGDDVVGVRRAEDVRSSVILGATSHHLDFWDRQYRRSAYGLEPTPNDHLLEAVCDALMALADQLAVDAWLIPLGISHADHELVACAGLRVARRIQRPVYLYEELPYRLEDRGAVTMARRRVAHHGFTLAPDRSLSGSAGRVVKLRSICCHRSQLRPLGARRILRALAGREITWRLSGT